MTELVIIYRGLTILDRILSEFLNSTRTTTIMAMPEEYWRDDFTPFWKSIIYVARLSKWITFKFHIPYNMSYTECELPTDEDDFKSKAKSICADFEVMLFSIRCMRNSMAEVIYGKSLDDSRYIIMKDEFKYKGGTE